ncbi:MAG: substrate-binding domain-containing protein [Marinilabiliaceae bacterium]|nr:substrate-binding domain-containing protein [Marinilabiliaceae bacterium]
MKYKGLLTILATFIILLSSCSNDKKIKVGFLYTSDVTERYVKESLFFKERAEQLGAEVIIEHADGKEALQYEKAVDMLEAGVDALSIISVNANTAAAIVREAHERGVPVLGYNRLIPNCELDLFLSGNNETLGKMMVEEVLKVKPSGNFIIMGGAKDDRNGLELQQSLEKHLEPVIQSGKVKILYKTFIEDWSNEHAAFELKQVLSFTGERPDAIFAGFDGIADGCIKVLDEYGYTDVAITGQDAELRAIKNILAGKQTMTVFHPLKTNAYTGAELAIDLANGKLPEKTRLSYVNNGMIDVPAIKIESITITKDNIEKVLIEGGFYTKAEVYN